MTVSVKNTLIICISIIIIMIIEKVADVIDKNNFYKALGDHPEISKLYDYEEDQE